MPKIRALSHAISFKISALFSSLSKRTPQTGGHLVKYMQMKVFFESVAKGVE